MYFFSGGSGGTADWVAQQVLKPDDLAMQDYFGHSIAQYHCRHVLVGAWGADSSSYVSLGAAYIYMNTGAGWKLEAKVEGVHCAHTRIMYYQYYWVLVKHMAHTHFAVALSLSHPLLSWHAAHPRRREHLLHVVRH